jgi:CheY-like chemotaxis protein
LSRATAACAAKATTAPADATAGGALTGLTTLVVDDEPDVADVLVDMLSVDGHRAEVAANGRMALERLKVGDFDLVMSDLRMPELDGAGLYRQLEALGHPILPRVVFVTGDVLGPEAQDFLERTRVPTLAKPFVFSEVRAIIQQLLGASGPNRA